MRRPSRLLVLAALAWPPRAQLATARHRPAAAVTRQQAAPAAPAGTHVKLRRIA